MNDVIETSTIYTLGPHLEVTVDMIDDDLNINPEAHAPDFDDDEQKRDYLARHQSGDWQFVGMEAQVFWEGIRLGDNALWGIEHGTVAEGVTANAWEIDPAKYWTDSEGRSCIQMPSPLSGVIVDALTEAEHTLNRLSSTEDSQARVAVQTAMRVFDPNRDWHEEVKA